MSLSHFQKEFSKTDESSRLPKQTHLTSNKLAKTTKIVKFLTLGNFFKVIR